MNKESAAFSVKSSQWDIFSLRVHRAFSHRELSDLEIHLDHLPHHETAHSMLVDVSGFRSDQPCCLEQILSLLQHKGILCAGLVHSDEEEGIELAKKYGLSLVHPDVVRTHAGQLAETPAPEQLVTEQAQPTKPWQATMVIDKPVRAGQQIYAPSSDLIVLSSVSSGAELIAGGHIHVYGVLRGRALAGASGDEQARIFSLSMQAELVSIAGMYRVFDEALPPSLLRQPVQIYLEQEKIVMKNLSDLLTVCV